MNNTTQTLGFRPVVSGSFEMRQRRVAIAIVLAICATLIGSLVPTVAHHANPTHAGLYSGVMLACEIAAYATALALVIRQLRAGTRQAPIGRGSSHL